MWIWKKTTAMEVVSVHCQGVVEEIDLDSKIPFTVGECVCACCAWNIGDLYTCKWVFNNVFFFFPFGKLTQKTGKNFYSLMKGIHEKATAGIF